MASTVHFQTAAYMVEWTRQYGTQWQQICAERAWRTLLQGTA